MGWSSNLKLPSVTKHKTTTASPSRLHFSLLHRSVPPPPDGFVSVERSGQSDLCMELFKKVVFLVDYVRILVVVFLLVSPQWRWYRLQ
jgi:hypothetical protein